MKPVQHKEKWQPATDLDKKSVPKIKLEYDYKEDQWSLLNPKGNKEYDREFLLHLRKIMKMSGCIIKPDNLPDLPGVILDAVVPVAAVASTHQSKSETETKRIDHTHKHSKPAESPKESDQAGGDSAVDVDQRSLLNPEGSQEYDRKLLLRLRKKMKISGRIIKPDNLPDLPGVILDSDHKFLLAMGLPIAPPVELYKAESSWVKSMQEKKKAFFPLSDEERATEELFHDMRSILNTLTPVKFMELIGQIKNLEINTEIRCTGVLDLIFEKAIDEPNFNVSHALLCKTLFNVVVQPECNVPGARCEPNLFRVKLPARCQAELEKDKANENELGKRKAEIKAEGNAKKKKQLELELDEALANCKRRSTGNIRFMGELFKLKMLTERIMHQCLNKLLQEKDEESLECLCRLFTTIGKGMDQNPDNKSQMDTYFTRLKAIMEEKSTTAEIRFLLLDVIDLRQNNWVPKRRTNNPKTTDQINKEAAAEKERDAMMAAQDNHMRANKARGRGGRPKRGGPSADDSDTVSTKPVGKTRTKRS